jgi:heme/copper-type cytochrome/quinol oxidase subunit 2
VSAAVVVFAVCAAGCVVAHLAILRSVLRHRTAAVADAAGIPRPNMLVEILWALVPMIALAFLLTATWNRVRERAHATAPVMMKVAQ